MAISNPFSFLLKSGLDDGVVGTGICEQVGAKIIGTFRAKEKIFMVALLLQGLAIITVKEISEKFNAAFIYNNTVNRSNNLSLEIGKWLNAFEIIVSILKIYTPVKK